MQVQEIVRLIAQERNEFELSYKFYNTLDLKVQQEIDRNYWRFPMSKGYSFKLMLPEEKQRFANKEMVIRRSMSDLCGTPELDDRADKLPWED